MKNPNLEEVYSVKSRVAALNHVWIALRPEHLSSPSSTPQLGFTLHLVLLISLAMSSTIELASAFIEGAPPGEVCHCFGDLPLPRGRLPLRFPEDTR